MDSLKSNALLRLSGRQGLIGKYSRAISIYVLFAIICSFLDQLLPDINIGSLQSIGIFLFFALYLSIFQSILKCGINHYFLKQNCGKDTATSDLFRFVIKPSGASFAYSAITRVLLLICLIPSLMYAHSNSQQIFTVSTAVCGILLMICGFIVYYLIVVNIAMVPYLISDFPDKKVKELIRLSIWMMKGQRIKYTMLVLSFVPLMLLSLLSLGLGLIWVMPYMLSTTSSFYLNLAECKAK